MRRLHLMVYPCGVSQAPSVLDTRAANLCDLRQALCVLEAGVAPAAHMTGLQLQPLPT